MTLAERLDAAILVTLWIEFFYDLLWNNYEARLKRRRNARKKPEFEHLTVGEGR